MPEGGQQVRGSGVSEQVPHNAVEAVGFLVGVFGQGAVEARRRKLSGVVAATRGGATSSPVPRCAGRGVGQAGTDVRRVQERVEGLPLGHRQVCGL
ncbi:hypothetical protein SSP35_34_00100 [Streptomyces sp. NBRC 110611]|nr:hypothetical protein SSP35_34_00100 [Streptomyces sp. NBRC 110611]